MRALIIVDVQNDFCEGGALAVAGGNEVALRISNALTAGRWDYVVTTQDWHVDPGSHFSDTPDYVDTWPVHCVARTPGAALNSILDDYEIFDAYFYKGEYSAAYSGFEGYSFEDSQPLAAWLREKEVTEVDICGIATDYCVKATAEDAVLEGFKTSVLTYLTAGVAPETTAQALSEMRTAGVNVI